MHAVTALTVLLTVDTAMYTNGINSTLVVWLHVWSMPVLRMLGAAATLVWIGITLLAILGLTVMTWWGIVGSHVDVSLSVVTAKNPSCAGPHRARRCGWPCDTFATRIFHTDPGTHAGTPRLSLSVVALADAFKRHTVQCHTSSMHVLL